MCGHVWACSADFYRYQLASHCRRTQIWLRELIPTEENASLQEPDRKQSFNWQKTGYFQRVAMFTIICLLASCLNSVESKVKSERITQSCLTLCDPMDCSPPGSSVHGILQARILKWVAISFSRGSSRPRDRTWVSCIAGWYFTIWATREVQEES